MEIDMMLGLLTTEQADRFGKYKKKGKINLTRHTLSYDCVDLIFTR